jgi:hypothetical protein
MSIKLQPHSHGGSIFTTKIDQVESFVQDKIRHVFIYPDELFEVPEKYLLGEYGAFVDEAAKLQWKSLLNTIPANGVLFCARFLKSDDPDTIYCTMYNEIISP